jgi:hypothetical protein
MNRLSNAVLALGATLSSLLAVDLLSVFIWGRNIGMAEDWFMVPAMTGNEPNLPAWLWSQNNEHRLPVQRLIYLGLLRATGDFRSGMILSQLLLALLATTLAWTAAKARGGRFSWTDVLFPLALLHLGHWANLVWGWQLQFVWSTVLAGLLLAIVAARPGFVSWPAAWAAAGLLLLLQLSGANGIIMAAPMALWLAAQGAARLSTGAEATEHRMAIVLIGAVLLSFVLIGIYFIGYEKPSWSPPPPTLKQFTSAAEFYFAYALGPGARWLLLPSVVAVVLTIGSGAVLASYAAVTRGAEERLRAFGLVLFIGAGVALGAGIAWGRGASFETFPDRYALFPALTLLAAAYAWELYAPARLANRVKATLVVAFVLLLPLNVHAGFAWRNWYVDGMRRVEADIAGGVPISEMAQRHYPFLMHWDEHGLRDAMQMLQDAKIGPFAGTPPK